MSDKVYTTNITVRSYECDSYSHVNNAVYLNYLEHARMDFLHQIGFEYKKVVAAGWIMPVTHIDIHYKNSAVLDDDLTVESKSVKLGAVSGTIHQIIKKNDGAVCAEAEVTWATVKDGKLTPLPKEYMVDGLKP